MSETQAFAERLRHALANAGIRASPTLVAHEFNVRYRGRNITPHTVRNWLLGQALPTQDKLVVLAEWLQVSPNELRFGMVSAEPCGAAADAQFEALGMADREMIHRYLGLSTAERKTVREVVGAMAMAAGLRARQT